MGYLLKR